MDIPVEIVFHNMPSKATVETEIRNRVDKLDRLYEHLIGCRGWPLRGEDGRPLAGTPGRDASPAELPKRRRRAPTLRVHTP